MSKLYKVNMNIDVSKATPNGGYLMKSMPKEADPKNKDVEFDTRGFKERTGPEVFEFICSAAINGANPKVSYDQGRSFRKITRDLTNAIGKGKFISNKTDLDIIKNSIKGNSNWPNTDEMISILDHIMNNLDNAENINENITSIDSGKGSEQKK